jgi:CRP-like cAMP-binding protein
MIRYLAPHTQDHPVELRMLEHEAAIENERKRIKEHLETIANRMRTDPNQWRSVVLTSNSVSNGISRAAVDEAVDLVAMYTHDRRGWASLVSGSVAGKMRRRLPIEVRAFTPPQLISATRDPRDRADQEKRILRTADLFKGLTDEQLGKVASIARRSVFRAGEVLGEAGSRSDRVFIVIRGEARITAHSSIGDITVRLAGTGESWPLAALVGLGTLVTSARALTEIQVLSVPCRELLTVCSRDPNLAWLIYGNISQVFTDRYDRTLSHLTLSEEVALEAGIERNHMSDRRTDGQ